MLPHSQRPSPGAPLSSPVTIGGAPGRVKPAADQTTPCAIIASTTLVNPAMFAPST